MRGVTFRTTHEYCDIPAGAIVQGVAMHDDGCSSMVGVAYTELRSADTDADGKVTFDPVAGYEHDQRGGWWYPVEWLEPLTREARDFLAAHLAGC